MKKAHSNSVNRKKIFFLWLLSLCLVFFNLSCGLDVISVVLEDPVSVSTSPNKESDSFSPQSTFSFSTRKLDNSNDLGKGYVYYKIYNKAEVQNSEVNSLTNMANSTNKQDSAHGLTESYGYKELHYTKDNSQNSDVLTLENKSQSVDIRLTNDVVDSDILSAFVKIDGAKIGLPVRINGSSFDFGKSGINDKIPLASDDDTPALEKFPDEQPEDEAGKYYVSLFYVFMMYDESYIPRYSPIRYLGTVTVNTKSF